MALIAVAEADNNVLSITDVIDALVGVDISPKLQVLEAEAWKALGMLFVLIFVCLMQEAIAHDICNIHIVCKLPERIYCLLN